MNEVGNQPLIVFFKDPEAVLMTSYERYSRFRTESEAVQGKVVFFGTSCTLSRSEVLYLIFAIAGRIAEPRESKPDRLSLLLGRGTEDSLLDFNPLDPLVSSFLRATVIFAYTYLSSVRASRVENRKSAARRIKWPSSFPSCSHAK